MVDLTVFANKASLKGMSSANFASPANLAAKSTLVTEFGYFDFITYPPLCKLKLLLDICLRIIHI